MSPTRYRCATPLHFPNLAQSLEAPRGLEPRTPDYETGVLPLELWSPYHLVGRQGLEPCLALYKNAVLTHTPTPVPFWSGTIESNDAKHAYQACGHNQPPHAGAKLVGDEGFEPSASCL